MVTVFMFTIEARFVALLQAKQGYVVEAPQLSTARRVTHSVVHSVVGL